MSFSRNTFFSSTPIMASAPGRLDVMGGIADYSGSLLLQMPIQEKTTVFMTRRSDQLFRVYSRDAEIAGLPALFEIELTDTLLQSPYPLIRDSIRKIPSGDWAGYILGCFILLAKEKNISISGAEVWVESEIPFGKGVSSSAAVEIATLIALAQLYNISLGKIELPLMAQKVENYIVGAACGLMDQLSSYLGEKKKLLPIVCQPVKVFDSINIPDGVNFTGIDSGVKHAVSGRAYTRVRVAAFMGYSIIAQQCGISKKEIIQSRITGDWTQLPYQGYLANINTIEFEVRFRSLLPLSITGEEFIRQFGNTIDSVTEIDPNEQYDVKSCTSHPIYENERVNKFRDIIVMLNQKPEYFRKQLLEQAGDLMVASHQSYTYCGLGNSATDQLVETIMTAGMYAPVYGAKITGGGSGGTICILSDGTEGLNFVRNLKREYESSKKMTIHYFEGSESGGYYLNQ